jgi:hypothetical protein
MSDLAETINVERDGLRAMLEAVAVTRQGPTPKKSKYGPAHGGIGGLGAGPYRCHRRETATRPH